ncbi:hypothetical protein F4780DRAFT_782234 [Xylariomycetidae sp. FL0641]|nr:hypothetical protein F4780DRAFT_782234 [Xylariomycetidae sp. FL0641]
MPTYLCHGFRWHRLPILYFVILENLEDAAPGWVVGPKTETAILERLHEKFAFLPPPAASPTPETDNTSRPQGHDRSISPGGTAETEERQRGRDDEDVPASRPRSRSLSRKLSKLNLRRAKPHAAREDVPPPLPTSPPPPPPPPPGPQPPTTPPPAAPSSFARDRSAVRLLEEFDPADETRASAPWAYVADHVERVGASRSLAEAAARYAREPRQRAGGGWLAKLRDELARDEPLGWYVVVCGDEERAVAGDDEGAEEEEEVDEQQQQEEEDDDEDASTTFSSELAARTHVSQSTALTSSSPSVFEHGFEFRLPELAGFGGPGLLLDDVVVPERKRRPGGRRDMASPPGLLPRSPTRSPPPPGPGGGGEARPRTGAAIRKFFARKNQTDTPTGF